MAVYLDLVNRFLSYRSLKTKQRLLVIESDDWGSRRTDTVAVRNRLNGISKWVAADPYTQFDNIAHESDLSALFEVLNSVRDKHDNPACVTINVTTANPDFEKIRDCKFEQFHYEPFHKTISNTADGARVLQMWREGIRNKYFYPQLHGREHVHALAWLKELQMGNKELLGAFDLNSYGIPYTALFKQRRKNLQASLDIYGIEGEEIFQEKWIREGQEIFRAFFQFESSTFIPPAYTWHNRINEPLRLTGIRGIQGLKLQYQPSLKKEKHYKRRLHFTGEHGANGIMYLVRNVFFEPSTDNRKDWVDETLSRIKKAFDNNHPAIIGSHRINFIGSLNVDNRDKNLAMLADILQSVIKRWPDVEFVSSDRILDPIK